MGEVIYMATRKAQREYVHPPGVRKAMREAQADYRARRKAGASETGTEPGSETVSADTSAPMSATPSATPGPSRSRTARRTPSRTMSAPMSATEQGPVSAPAGGQLSATSGLWQRLAFWRRRGPAAATVPSLQPPPAPAPVLSLGDGLEHAVHSALAMVCMAGAAVCNFVLQQWTMCALFGGNLGPVPCGWAAAGGLNLLEVGVGHALGQAWGRPGKRGSVALLLVVAIGIAASEAMLPLIRETEAHKQAVQDTSHEPRPQTQCIAKDPPPAYGSTRLPIWQEGERRRMADCRAAEASERREAQGALVKAADEHSAWETPFRVVFGMVLSLGIVALSAAVGDFVHALRVVGERLLVLPGRGLAWVAGQAPWRRRPAGQAGTP
jgi:hypothetical protein